MPDLNHGPTRGRVGRILNQPITARKIDIIMKQPPRGHWVDFQHRCVDRLDFRRHCYEFTCFDRERFAPGSNVVRQNHERAFGNRRHIRAHLDHDARAFEAGHRRHFATTRIFSFDCVDVRRIDRRRAHRNDGFIGGGGWPGLRLNLQNVRRISM